MRPKRETPRRRDGGNYAKRAGAFARTHHSPLSTHSRGKTTKNVCQGANRNFPPPRSNRDSSQSGCLAAGRAALCKRGGKGVGCNQPPQINRIQGTGRSRHTRPQPSSQPCRLPFPPVRPRRTPAGRHRVSRKLRRRGAESDRHARIALALEMMETLSRPQPKTPLQLEIEGIIKRGLIAGKFLHDEASGTACEGTERGEGQ